MAKKNQHQILSEIYNQTLESLLRNKINLKLYEDLDPNENIIPQELVDTGMKQPKTAQKRMEEISEMIDTSKRTLVIIEDMMDHE